MAYNFTNRASSTFDYCCNVYLDRGNGYPSTDTYIGWSMKAIYNSFSGGTYDWVAKLQIWDSWKGKWTYPPTTCYGCLSTSGYITQNSPSSRNFSLTSIKYSGTYRIYCELRNRRTGRRSTMVTRNFWVSRRSGSWNSHRL